MLWAVEDDPKLIQINVPSRLKVATFSPDGRYVVGGDLNGKVRQWQVEDGAEVGSTMNAGRPIYTIVISKDGKWIVTGSPDEAAVWDIETHDKVVGMKAHWDLVTSIDVSPDSTRVVSGGSWAKTVLVWDIKTGRRLVRRIKHKSYVHAVKFSPGGERIATSAGGKIHIHNSHTGKGVKSWGFGRSSSSFAWSNDGQRLFVAYAGSISCHDVSTGAALSKWSVGSSRSAESDALRLSGNGRFIVSLMGGYATFWDAETHTQFGPIIDNVCGLADNSYFACSMEKKIAIWSIRDILPNSYFSDRLPSVPFMHISVEALEAWLHDKLLEAESILSKEIALRPISPHHGLANRALVRTRLRQWDAAYCDAQRSIEIQPSLMGYIARTLVLSMKTEYRSRAIKDSDISFHECTPKQAVFLSLVQAIVLSFTATCVDDYDKAISRVNDLFALATDKSIYYYVREYMNISLVRFCMKNGDYEHAVEFSERIQVPTRFCTGSELEAISLIFGWKFNDLLVMARQQRYEALRGSGRTERAKETLDRMFNDFGQDIRLKTELANWFEVFTLAIEGGIAEWVETQLKKNGWKEILLVIYKLNLPMFGIHKAICDALRKTKNVMEAIDFLHKVIHDVAKGTAVRKENDTWISEFSQSCIEIAERIGDAAMATQKYDEALMHYTAALSLEPSFNEGLAIRREKARLVTMVYSWDTTLKDQIKADTPLFTIYQQACELLLDSGHVEKAIQILRALMIDHDMDLKTNGEKGDWVANFKRRCTETAERLGSEAMASERYDEAFNIFSAALFVDRKRLSLLLKRNEARTRVDRWADVLRHANELISLDPCSPWGYESKHAALHGLNHYDYALEAFESMLLKIEQSLDPDIRALRSQFVTPNDTRTVIRNAVKHIIRDSPLVLIDTKTGHLCNKARQESSFEDLPLFKELVSFATMPQDHARIVHAVEEYYRYAMLSHTWEGKEPEFPDIRDKSVYDVRTPPLIEKLQQFCRIVGEAGIHWAWSDTCCIERDQPRVLQQSLISMFKWYRGAWRTIIILRGVQSPLLPLSIKNSLWITRAWTFQEYVASPFVWFYTADWKPYLDLGASNHKESPAVISEMELATGVSAHGLRALGPGVDAVLQKLQLASNRKTTVEEDAAYSLFGIFDIDSVPVRYSEGTARAIGHLLEQIISKSRDVVVLDWAGNAGNYNSCLPADLRVYSDAAVRSHIPSPIEEALLETMIVELEVSLQSEDVAEMFYDRLEANAQPRMIAGQLDLPCIRFPLENPVRVVGKSGVYRASVRGLADVEIRTAEDLCSLEHLFLVHPWIQTLLDFALSTGNGGVEADKRTRILRLIGYLRQPFGALMLAREGVGHREQYRRVVTDTMIMVHIPEDTPLTQLMEQVHILHVS